MSGTTSWVFLVLAGLFEIGWPIGLKLAQSPSTRWLGIAVAIFFMSISGYLLWLAQKTIPMGTAYAVWTGLGATGTFAVGVLAFGDPTSLIRYFGLAFIILGVILLKIGS